MKHQKLLSFIDCDYLRLTTPETWIEYSNRNIQNSQSERAKSAQIRTDTDNVINSHANDCWNAWTTTNAALDRRSNEIMDVKQKLQTHLHKVCSTKTFFSVR